MESGSPNFRYEMVNIQPGYIVVEKEMFSLAARSYFSAEPSPPVEEYREGGQFWKSSPVAQSVRFDIRDNQTREVISFAELLGLAYWASCRPESEIYKIGDMAQENRVSVYVAVTFERAGRSGPGIPMEKLRILNRYFNERLQRPDKKILILPDYFDLYKEFSTGQIMADLGLTAME